MTALGNDTDLSSPEHIVIIGAGQAAASAVETLREEGHRGRITLIGAEPHLPYERPPLSKSVLAGEKKAAETELHDRAWYDEHQVTVHTTTTATALDLAARTVTIDAAPSDGAAASIVHYDALLLATGAEPKVPGIPGASAASYLRTQEDAEAIREAFTPDGHVVLVGGGWIGLELAAAARGAGMRATVLEQADLPLGGVLGEELAQHLVDLHRQHGVDVRTGVAVEEVTLADGRASGVRLGDGEHLDADLVVVAIGAAPRVGLAQAAGLGLAAPEDGGGIVTDQHLRTTDPAVWAAGDVAHAVHTVLGPLRVEHWDNALRQGKAAAKSILGQEVSYDWLPYFFTDQFEFGMEYVGHGSADDIVEIRGSQSDQEFIAYWLDPGDGSGHTVTAAMAVGIWGVDDKLREIVGTVVDPGALTDLR